MPERGDTLFTSDKAGESINSLDPYYARMIADGDLVAVEEEPPAPPADKPIEDNRHRATKGA